MSSPEDFANAVWSCPAAPPPPPPPKLFRLFPSSWKDQKLLEFYQMQLCAYAESGECNLEVYNGKPGYLQAKNNFLCGHPELATSTHLFRCAVVFHKKSTSPTVKTPDAEKHFRPNESGISLRNVHLFDPPAGSHPHCLKLLIVSVDWEPTREVSEPKRKRRKGQEDCDDVKPYAVYALTSHQEVEYFETGSSSAVQDGGYKPELTSSARARLLIYLPGPTCHPNDEIPSSLPPPPTGCPHCGRPLHSLTEEQRNKALKRLEEKIMPEISRTMHDAGASMDAGKIMKVFEEILQVSWADHCLRPDHRSLTKEQIREHIKQHHRLPGMRSEEDVKRFGIDVRKDLPALLAAVEELYLLYLKDEKDLQTGGVVAQAASISHHVATASRHGLSSASRAVKQFYIMAPTVLPLLLLLTSWILALLYARQAALILRHFLMTNLSTRWWIVREMQRMAAGKHIAWLQAALMLASTLLAIVCRLVLMCVFKYVGQQHLSQQQDARCEPLLQEVVVQEAWDSERLGASDPLQASEPAESEDRHAGPGLRLQHDSHRLAGTAPLYSDSDSVEPLQCSVYKSRFDSESDSEAPAAAGKRTYTARPYSDLDEVESRCSVFDSESDSEAPVAAGGHTCESISSRTPRRGNSIGVVAAASLRSEQLAAIAPSGETPSSRCCRDPEERSSDTEGAALLRRL